MKLKRKQIIRIFSISPFKEGYWLSGKKGEGEYKSWYTNGQLKIQWWFKNNERDGESKAWYEDGQLWVHFWYKNNNDIVADFIKHPKLKTKYGIK